MTEEKYFFEEKVFSRPDYEFNFEPDLELIEDILRYKKSGRVLELGYGEGGTSLELARRGFDVTCIDISKTAVKAIIKEAKSKNIKINAIWVDLENYRIEVNFEVIISNGVFHFLPEANVLSLIKDCQAHTSKKGINIFEVMLEGDPSQEDDAKGYYFPKGRLKLLYSNWDIEGYEEYEEYDKDEEWNNKLARIIAIKV